MHAPDPEALGPLLDAVLAVAEDLDLDGVLDRVVHAARALVGSQYAALGVLDGTGRAMDRFLHAGIDATTAAAIGPLPTGHGVLGEVIRHPEPLVLDDLTTHPASSGFPAHHPPMTSFLGVPVVVAGEVFGNLYLTDKPGGFADGDVRLVVALAAVAGTAIRNARDAEALEQWAVRADRERIARDLHDTVIQRLFGAGLQLDGVRRRLDDDAAEAVERVIGELDAAIADLRGTIAALHDAGPAPADDRLHAVVAALQPATPSLRRLVVEGDLDSVPEGLVKDLAAVLREGIANATRHAPGAEVRPRVVVAADRVELLVQDDGPGPDDAAPSRPGAGLGLGNLAARAARHGGTSELVPGPDGRGTLLRWSVPR